MSERSASGVLPPTGSHDRLPMTARVGIVIAALLGLADIAFGAAQLDPDQVFPNVVSIFLIAAGISTLAAVPLAWRGARWAGWLIVVLRILSAMTGLPAFFVSGIPAGFVVAAAAGILLAALVAVLMLMKMPATS